MLPVLHKIYLKYSIIKGMSSGIKEWITVLHVRALEQAENTLQACLCLSGASFSSWSTLLQQCELSPLLNYCCNNVGWGHCWSTVATLWTYQGCNKLMLSVERGYCWSTLLHLLFPVVMLISHLMWNEEHHWNFSVLQGVHLSNLVSTQPRHQCGEDQIHCPTSNNMATFALAC